MATQFLSLLGIIYPGGSRAPVLKNVIPSKLHSAVKLPNGDKAVVAIDKLTGYVLNAEHVRGGNKARVFRAALGFGIEHAEQLRAVLLEAAANSEASHRGHSGYGESYTIIFSVVGPNGNLDFIKSGWQIDDGTDFPRLVSCYVDR